MTADELQSSEFSNKNFQTILTKLLTIENVDNGINQTDYVTQVSNSQKSVISSTLNNFINYDSCFRYGNPGNFDRKVFGTFSSVPTINGIGGVADPYEYNAYVSGSLPTTFGTTTLAQSQALYPEAWQAMYLNVGFGSEPEMVYSNNGSYFTDFFTTMDVEFTETNV